MTDVLSNTRNGHSAESEYANGGDANDNIPKVEVKEELEDSDDDVPLGQLMTKKGTPKSVKKEQVTPDKKKRKKQGSDDDDEYTPEKRKDKKSKKGADADVKENVFSDDDDIPLSAKYSGKKPKKEKKVKKEESSDEEDYEEKKKTKKKDTKRKSTATTTASSPAKKKKKEEEQEDVWECRRKNYIQLTREEKVKIEALSEAGWSSRRIQKELGRSKTTVNNYLKKLLFPPEPDKRGGKRSLNDEDREIMLQMASTSTLGVRKLAAQLPNPVSASTVWRELKRAKKLETQTVDADPSLTEAHEALMAEFVNSQMSARWKELTIRNNTRTTHDGDDKILTLEESLQALLQQNGDHSAS